MRALYTIIVVLCLGLCSNTLLAAEPDWQAYDQLLKKYVKPGRLSNVDLMTVDYVGVKEDAAYQQTLSQIAKFDTRQLKTKAEKLAFYINAYNILAIKMVLDHWPVKSIKDAGSLFTSVWKKDVGKINRKTISLHIIEHEILRKMGDPRIHMAIVCASISCPDLRNEAYTAKKLNNQLDDQARLFLINRKKGLYISGNTVHVSKIFDWFEDDFKVRGGVKKFIQHYNPIVKNTMEIEADIDYNWHLNNR